MKNKIMAVILLALGTALSCLAQPATNIVVTTVQVTNVVTTTTNSLLPGVGLGQLGSDLANFLTDASPFYSNNIILTMGGTKVDSRWGGLLDIGIPLTQNGQIAMGFAGLYMLKGNGQPAQFYTGAVNLQAGKTVTLLGQDFQLWAASGPGYNNSTHSIILYSATGASWNTHLGKGELTLSGGALNVSDAPGVGYFGALSYGFKL